MRERLGKKKRRRSPPPLIERLGSNLLSTSGMLLLCSTSIVYKFTRKRLHCLLLSFPFSPFMFWGIRRNSFTFISLNYIRRLKQPTPSQLRHRLDFSDWHLLVGFFFEQHVAIRRELPLLFISDLKSHSLDLIKAQLVRASVRFLSSKFFFFLFLSSG